MYKHDNLKLSSPSRQIHEITMISINQKNSARRHISKSNMHKIIGRLHKRDMTLIRSKDVPEILARLRKFD
jgi:hypothetical protein